MRSTLNPPVRILLTDGGVGPEIDGEVKEAIAERVEIDNRLELEEEGGGRGFPLESDDIEN